MRKIKLKNKKGNLLTDEPIGLIIAVAAIAIIGILLWKLLFPMDANKESQKSFFSNLQKATSELKPGQSSEFLIWGNDYIHAVYFGDRHIVPFSPPLALTIDLPIIGKLKGIVPWLDYNILFRSDHNYERAFCICFNSEKDVDYNGESYNDARCNYCTNLPGKISKIEIVDNTGRSTGIYDFPPGMPIILASGDKVIFNRYNNGEFYVKWIGGNSS